MIAPYLKAIAQALDPRFRKVLVRSLAATLATFLALWGLVWVVTAKTRIFESGWLEGIADAFGGLLAIALTWLLFPAVVGMVMSLFIDDVADAVEERHYPGLGPARRQGLGEMIWTTARFTGLLVVLNLIALPIYLIPVANVVVFYLINAALLGREYFELVACRRLPVPEADALRRANRWPIFLAGGPAVFLFTVPVINLVAPIVAAAALVHVFHRLRARSPAPGP
jgi:uncharacterized protein involved in cysteine biosynthesis